MKNLPGLGVAATDGGQVTVKNLMYTGRLLGPLAGHRSCVRASPSGRSHGNGGRIGGSGTGAVVEASGAG
jgi:hypothetical protein